MSWTDLDPGLQQAGSALIDVATQAGVNPQVTSTKRSYWKQLELYTSYASGRARLPAAPPGRSAHEYGWAFDMVVADRQALSDLGALWESWGGTYGGVADPVHFELPGASAWLRSASLEQIASVRYPNMGIGEAVARTRQDMESVRTALGWVGPWWSSLLPDLPL